MRTLACSHQFENRRTGAIPSVIVLILVLPRLYVYNDLVLVYDAIPSINCNNVFSNDFVMQMQGRFEATKPLCLGKTPTVLLKLEKMKRVRKKSILSYTRIEAR